MITVRHAWEIPTYALKAQRQATGEFVVWEHGDALPAATAIPLEDIKAQRIATINAECQARITAVWPLEKQISATLGIYGQAELDAMTAFIDAHISASNVASDAVDAATSQSAVEAVTVAWPA